MPQPPVQQRLDEALTARHALLTGTAKARIGYGDRQVEYARDPAAMKRLDAYIAELRRELSGARRPRNRVIYAVPD